MFYSYVIAFLLSAPSLISRHTLLFISLFTFLSTLLSTPILTYFCNVRAFRYKRILFFYELPRCGAFLSLRLRLRHCLLWCRELSMLPRTLVFAGFLGVLCRALRARIVCMLPRAMVPRARPNGLDVSRGAAHSYVAAHPWCRALECRRASVLPRTRAAAPLSMLPRSYTCCRAPMVPRAAKRYVVLVCVAASHVAAQFSVWTRPMLPRSSLCCRVPCCRAVL